VKIRGNTLKGNMGMLVNKGGSCYDAQIIVNNSQGVEISDNTVESVGVNGICASDTVRSERAVFPQFLSNLNVHGNIVRAKGASVSGVVYARTPSGVTFDRNQYFVHDLSAQHWQYGAKQTRAQWMMGGQDGVGSFAAW